MFFRFFFTVYCLIFIPTTYSSDLTKIKKSFYKTASKKLKEHSIPGATYVIVQNNKIIALESFGYTDKTQSKKINSNTVFRLASVSKPFAATITTMLAQEKHFNVSDPITKFVPNFVLAKKNAAEKIQIKHILSHSSGLMPNAYDNLLHENWSMEKIIGRFNRVTPICKPEQCYGYQNIAYGFLQPVIEKSQPKSYENLLKERIFTPLKMTNASVGIDAFLKQKNSAKPHVLIQRKRTNKKDKKGNKISKYIWHNVKVKPDYYKVAPAAGINASITDLAKWLNANMGYSPKVLSATLLKEVTTPRIKTKKDLNRKHWKHSLKNAHYGYGWRIYQFEKSPIIYHSGWVSGFRADIGYSPSLDIGFAILMNAESNLINQLSHEFWKEVHK